MPLDPAIKRTRERLALARGLLRAHEDVLHIQPPSIPSLADSLAEAAKNGGGNGPRLILQNLIRACEDGDAQGLRAVLESDRARIMLITSVPATTLLMRAAMRNHTGVLHVLLGEAPEPLRRLDATDAMGWTALALAVFFKSSACARILLAKGASANIQNMYGRTPLHIAVGLGALDLVAILLKDAPTIAVDLQDAHGATPLVLAVLQGRDDMTSLLLKRNALPTVKYSPAAFSLLHLCVPEAHTRVFSLIHAAVPGMLNSADAFGRTPLHIAVVEQQADMLDFILQLQSVRLDSKDKSGRTPLYCAAMQGDADSLGAILGAAARAGPAIMVATLLGDRDNEGLTPLHRTLLGGHVECLRMLLASGASISELAPGSTSAAMIAAASSLGCLEVLLHTKDADSSLASSLDSLQRNVCHHAALGGHVRAIELLSQRKLDFNVQDSEGLTPLMLAVIAQKSEAVLDAIMAAGASVNVQDSKGFTALHYAVETGVGALVIRLMAHKADPFIFDQLSRQPLHVAAFQGNHEVIDALLDEGVGVNSGTPESGRALHWAVRGVREATVELLLARGADPNATECPSEEAFVETPLDVSYNLQSWDCAAPLVVRGASTCELLLERSAAIIQAVWRIHKLFLSDSAAASEKREAAKVWAIMGVSKRHYRAVRLECEGRRLGLAPPADGWYKGASQEERAIAAKSATQKNNNAVSAELSKALIRLEVKKDVMHHLKARCENLHETLAASRAIIGSKSSASREDKLRLRAELKQALGDAVKLRSDTVRVNPSPK